MGKYKTQKLIITILLSIIGLLAIFSCSPIKRHARLVKKYPFVHQTDTVVLKDTISLTIPTVQKDTIIQLDSFLINLKDTIVIEKDNLSIKIMQIHDSIYIDGLCDTIYIEKIVTQKIPIKYYKAKEEFSFKKNIFNILYIFLIILLLIIIFKVIQFLKK